MLYDAVAADDYWTSGNSGNICVKTAINMMKTLSLQHLNSQGEVVEERRAVLHSITNQSPVAVSSSSASLKKRSYNEITPPDCGGFPTYNVFDYSTSENLDVTAPSVVEPSTKVCRFCATVNRVKAVLCCECTKRFEVVPTVVACGTCYEEINTGMKNCDLCGAMNSFFVSAI